MKEKISITIDENALEDIDSIIDNIIIRNRSQAIEHLVRHALGDNRTAVLLSGGDEEKLKISQDEFRLTAKIGNKRLVERSIKKLRDNNFKTIFIVARHNILTQIFSMLKDGTSYGVKINYIEEKKSNGSADSLRLLKGRIKNNFLVVYGDIFFNKVNIDALWDAHIKQNAVATLMLTTSPTPSKKGIVKMEGSKVLEFIQKPLKSDIYIGFSSIFAAEPEILNYIGDSLEYDVFPELAEKGLLNGHLSSEKEIHIHSRKDIKKIS